MDINATINLALERFLNARSWFKATIVHENGAVTCEILIHPTSMANLDILQLVKGKYKLFISDDIILDCCAAEFEVN